MKTCPKCDSKRVAGYGNIATNKHRGKCLDCGYEADADEFAGSDLICPKCDRAMMVYTGADYESHTLRCNGCLATYSIYRTGSERERLNLLYLAICKRVLGYSRTMITEGDSDENFSALLRDIEQLLIEGESK